MHFNTLISMATHPSAVEASLRSESWDKLKAGIKESFSVNKGLMADA